MSKTKDELRSMPLRMVEDITLFKGEAMLHITELENEIEELRANISGLVKIIAENDNPLNVIKADAITEAIAACENYQDNGAFCAKAEDIKEYAKNIREGK